MRIRWGLLFVLLLLVGCAATSQTTTLEQRQCNVGQPDTRINACTAIIQSGRQTQQDLSNAFVNRAGAYNDKGQYDRAIEDTDQAIRLSPDNPGALERRGEAFAGKGQYDRAIEDYDQAIQDREQALQRWSPQQQHGIAAYTLTPLLFKRGDAYAARGQYDRAVQDYDGVISFNPAYAKAFLARGVALRALGQQARAAADFAKAKQLNPNLTPPP